MNKKSEEVSICLDLIFNLKPNLSQTFRYIDKIILHKLVTFKESVKNSNLTHFFSSIKNLFYLDQTQA